MLLILNYNIEFNQNHTCINKHIKAIYSLLRIKAQRTKHPQKQYTKYQKQVRAKSCFKKDSHAKSCFKRIQNRCFECL